ncbi:hypothetical protein OROMI_006305 [Orobanche minor]
MSGEGSQSAAVSVYEEGCTSIADMPVQRPEAPIPIDSEGYSWLVSSYEGSPGVESRTCRGEGQVDLSEETALEAIRAGVDPQEVEAAFNDADVARREAAERLPRNVETDDQEEWEVNTPLGKAFVMLANVMDALDSRSLTFDFLPYLVAHPHQHFARSDF